MFIVLAANIEKGFLAVHSRIKIEFNISL